MNNTIHINEFMEEAKRLPVIDVRSPAEFKAGHMPGAINIPLFSDEERVRVGTTYKQIGREKAIEIGYSFVNPKLDHFLAEVKKISETFNKTSPLLVHCWRGGMRSAGFADFLRENGYAVSTLIRGYKAYRNFVLDSFKVNLNLILLGGETGSGKSGVLRKMAENGQIVVDLEALAHHKGSAFGALGEEAQPSQEQFENNLSQKLSEAAKSRRVWLEDESRSIGTCQLPAELWDRMKEAPIVRIRLPIEARIDGLVEDYGRFSTAELEKCILKIQKRLGPQHAKAALEELHSGNLAGVARIALVYYDKAYNYCHEKREYRDVHFLDCEGHDGDKNANRVIEFAEIKFEKANV